MMRESELAPHQKKAAKRGRWAKRRLARRMMQEMWNSRRSKPLRSALARGSTLGSRASPPWTVNGGADGQLQSNRSTKSRDHLE